MAKPMRLTPEMINEYIAQGFWDEVSIADILKKNALSYPEKEALVDSMTRLTWAELDTLTNSVAAGLLKKGMKRDQALVVQIPTSVDSLITLLACHKAGIVCCFAPMTFRQNEMKHVIKALKAKAVLSPIEYRNTSYHEMAKEISGDLPQLEHIIVSAEQAPEGAITLRSLCDVPFDDESILSTLEKNAFGPFEVSTVVLSSGTTGMPKCIEHTGASSKTAGWGVIQRAGLTTEDIVGNIAPLSGGPGLQNWWGVFQLGAKMCLLEHFSPEDTLKFIERERITYLPAIPTQLIKVLKECDVSRYDISSLKIVRTGAAAFDTAMALETEEKMKCRVLIAGGSQETYSFAQTSIDDPREKRLNTLGKPFPGNEIKICNDKGKKLSQGQVGHMYVRGAATSSGYFGDMDATLTAWGSAGIEGWYQTGDLARLDEDGYLIIVGREKEMINRGGQNIYPKEIEDLLLAHPGITHAVVIGIPDDVLGERACACVTCLESEPITFKEMSGYLKEKGLAIHKLPERLEVFEKFSQLVDGQKIDKLSVAYEVLERIEKEKK